MILIVILEFLDVNVEFSDYNLEVLDINLELSDYILESLDMNLEVSDINSVMLFIGLELLYCHIVSFSSFNEFLDLDEKYFDFISKFHNQNYLCKYIFLSKIKPPFFSERRF